VDINEEINQLQAKTSELLTEIYGNLNAWQISQVARHPQRPYTIDYIQALFTDFEELHGDRAYADDPAIVGGIARFDGKPVMVIGHQKGRDVKERQLRNFGMPRPEGYRKALRLYRMAEKFGLPIITLIDTPGAYPGIGAEERGQSEAIARNLYVMSELKTPIIGVIIGEGGSGGALALGVVDQMLMLQYSTYSVISPEGCASILFRSADQASVAAEALAITAPRLKSVGLVDRVVEEPMGGAHRSWETMMQSLQKALSEELTKVQKKSLKDLLKTRYEKLMSFGQYQEGQ
jgi:acetyl-CoA carboxylase carboxyl transferase subunit alpha